MDDLGGRDERVVGLVRLGGVTGHPAHGQPAPVGALLPHHHRELQAVATRNRESTASVIAEVGRVDGVVGEPAGAVGAERLLVGHRQVRERPVGAEALTRPAGAHRRPSTP